MVERELFKRHIRALADNRLQLVTLAMHALSTVQQNRGLHVSGHNSPTTHFTFKTTLAQQEIPEFRARCEHEFSAPVASLPLRGWSPIFNPLNCINNSLSIGSARTAKKQWRTQHWQEDHNNGTGRIDVGAEGTKDLLQNKGSTGCLIAGLASSFHGEL